MNRPYILLVILSEAKNLTRHKFNLDEIEILRYAQDDTVTVGVDDLGDPLLINIIP